MSAVPEGWRDVCGTALRDGRPHVLAVGKAEGQWWMYGFPGAKDEPFPTMAEACTAAERAYCGAYVGRVVAVIPSAT